jgi:hypothetical protein
MCFSKFNFRLLDDVSFEEDAVRDAADLAAVKDETLSHSSAFFRPRL